MTSLCRKLLWVSGMKSATVLNSEPEGAQSVMVGFSKPTARAQVAIVQKRRHRTLSSQKAALQVHRGFRFEIPSPFLGGLADRFGSRSIHQQKSKKSLRVIYKGIRVPREIQRQGRSGLSQNRTSCRHTIKTRPVIVNCVIYYLSLQPCLTFLETACQVLLSLIPETSQSLMTWAVTWSINI